jgi:UDP-glucose 4-epimerase
VRALVTGGCGFIGSAVVNRLVSEGDVIDIIDDLSNGNPANLEHEFFAVPPALLSRYPREAEKNRPLLITGDFADREILTRIKSGIYNVVYHLAANPRVAYSVESPVESNETNLHKSLAVFKTAADSNTRVVFSSSSAIYGNPESLPTHEEDNKFPESPYGLQKLLCEQYLDLFTKLYNIDAISLRYFNVYGPKALGDSPYSTAIAAWCHGIHDGRQLRSDGDGEQTRDLVYVDDISEANFLAGRREKKFKSEKVNIACGVSFSNNHILKLLKEQVGNLDIRNTPVRKGDILHTRGSTNWAKEVLGFETSISLEVGLLETLKWWGLDSARS